ncbi:MAG: type II toxin-antitoxin system RelE/ParE family toxin [Bacteroidia bacterium]
MIVRIDKSFEKDTNKIKDSKLLLKVAVCIQKIQNCNTVKEIKQLKKLTGFDKHYRIKIGDYRLGIIINGNEVAFERMLHRKEIYKYYP